MNSKFLLMTNHGHYTIACVRHRVAVATDSKVELSTQMKGSELVIFRANKRIKGNTTQ